MLVLQGGTQTPLLSLSIVPLKAPLGLASGDKVVTTLGQDTLSGQVVDGRSTTASWFLVCAIEGCGGSQSEGTLENH